MLKRCWNYVSIIIFLILLAFRIYSWVRNGAIGSEAPGMLVELHPGTDYTFTNTDISKIPTMSYDPRTTPAPYA